MLQRPVLGAEFTLQAMSVDVTSVTGELLCGRRTQNEPWSTLLTHISWKVACPATYVNADASRAAENNILTRDSKRSD